MRLAWETRCWQQPPQKALPGCRMALGDGAASMPPLARPCSQGQLSRRRHVRLSEKKGLFTSSEFFLHFPPLFPCFLLIRKCSLVPSCSPACPQPSTVSVPVRLKAQRSDAQGMGWQGWAASWGQAFPGLEKSKKQRLENSVS